MYSCAGKTISKDTLHQLCALCIWDGLIFEMLVSLNISNELLVITLLGKEFQSLIVAGKNCCHRFWLSDKFDGIIKDCVFWRVEWNVVQSLEEGFQLNYLQVCCPLCEGHFVIAG